MRGLILIVALCSLAVPAGFGALGVARADPAEGRKLPWEREAAKADDSEPATETDPESQPDADAPPPAETPEDMAADEGAADDDAGRGPSISETSPPEDESKTASDADTASEPEADTEQATNDAPVPAHPVVAIIRERLADADLTKGAAPDDAAALEAFYSRWAEPPVWVTETGLTEKGQAALDEIARANAWGLDATDFTLPEPDLLPASDEGQALVELQLALAVLKYARYARGGRTEPSRVSDLFDQTPPMRDPQTVMAEVIASDAPDTYLQSLHPQHEQFQRLREALLKTRETDKPSETDIRRLVINMERWRWMPEELGPLYVWLNTPDFMLYVVKDDKEIHKDKTLVGTIDYPTPIFSADMKTIVFNPDWIAPPSVLRDKLWPALKRKQYSILKSNKLLVSRNGRRIDPSKVDWRRVNIHNYTFKQKSGPKNVLGKAKFLYPNKHVVYMHDTLPYRKKVFKEDNRSIGYGCVRMENPQTFAALMLSEDHELPKSDVVSMWKKGVNKAVTMEHEPPVHTTYFTALVDEDGTVSTYKDLYGLDREHASVLFDSTEGFPVPPPAPKEESGSRNVASTTPNSSGSRGAGFANSLGFGGN